MDLKSKPDLFIKSTLDMIKSPTNMDIMSDDLKSFIFPDNEQNSVRFPSLDGNSFNFFQINCCISRTM